MMTQDEFSARRNSVKRSGKRITVDMRKELDSLIDECFTDGEENSTTTNASDTDATNVSASTSSNEIIPPTTSTEPQVEENIISNNSSNNHDNDFTSTITSTTSTTIDKAIINSQPKTPRLQYSNSQSKLTLPKQSDGNGRSSTIDSPGNDTEKQKEGKVDKHVQNMLAEGEPQTSNLSSNSILSNTTPAPATVVPKAIPPSLSISISSSNTSPLPSPTSPQPSLFHDNKGRRSLFFDNAASKVVKAVIITTNTVHSPQGAYTSYVMEVSSEGGMVVQNVSKRFKNFTELVEKLRDKAPELQGMLPARVVLGNMAAKLVSQRKVQLQILLDYILNHKDLSRSVDVHAFFRNPTLLAQLASKPDMEGYLQKGFVGALGMKYIQMWVLMKSPCLYFCQSPLETAELKSAVILRWLTVEIIDEMTFTFELRPWQHLFFPSDPQSKPISIRASSREEMVNWVRAIHRVKASVSDIIMLKKTMLLEEDAPSEAEIGEDEDEQSQPQSPSQPPPLPPLSLSGDSIPKPTTNNNNNNNNPENDTTLLSPRKPSPSSSVSPSPSQLSLSSDSVHRIRNQTQPAPLPSPKLVTRSQTEGQLTLIPRSKTDASISSPSPSLVIPTSAVIRQSTPVSKLKDFVEKPDIPPLSRFETRMALMKGPPKYP